MNGAGFRAVLPLSAHSLPEQAEQCVTALAQVSHNLLTRLQMVVFELQDGVALQNTYDMLAQRERAIAASGFFAHIGGRAMSDVDLVRNHLLNMIADHDERVVAYEEYWLPMEKAQGDGDAATLERFMRRYVAGVAATLPSAQMPPPPPRVATSPRASQRAPPSMVPLLEDIVTILRERGGAAGPASLYQQGVDSAASAPVAAGRAERVSLDLLKDMCDAAVARKAAA